MTEKSIDVIVVGELNVDLIMNGMAAFPVIGKEVLADRMTLTLGSSSAIFSSNLSTLGSKVAFVGNIGDDQFGDLIINSLKERKVNIENIHRSAEYQTGATIILNAGEDRAMVTHTGAMKYLTIQDIPWDVVKRARHFHLSSVFLQDGLFPDITALFKKAKELGLTTSMDPQWDPDEKWNLPMKELLPFIDVFMPNINELNALTQTSDLNAGLDALKEFANTIVVKNGSNGAYAWWGNKLTHQDAFVNNEVADSIGAGDSFDAGFIHFFVQGKSVYECLEFGAVTGAVNTTRAGGTTAFANIDLVRSIAQNSFNYTIS